MKKKKPILFVFMFYLTSAWQMKMYVNWIQTVSFYYNAHNKAKNNIKIELAGNWANSS